MAISQSNIVTPEMTLLQKPKPLLPGLGGDSTPAAPINFSGGLNMKPPTSTPTASPAAPALKSKVTETYHAPTPPDVNPNAALQTQGLNAKPLIPLKPFQDSTTDATTAAKGNIDIGAKAEEVRTRYGKAQQDLNIFNNAAAGDRTTGTQAVGGGNANIEYDTASRRSAALSTAEASELGGIDRQLTAQNQAQSGLISVGGLVKPQVGPQGETFYDPATGQITAAGNQAALNPLANIDSIAKQVVNGQLSPSQANQLGGNVQNFAGALNQAILALNPQYDQARAQAQFDAKQSNIQNSGTASIDAAKSGYSGAVQEYRNATEKYQGLTGVAGQLTETLGKWQNSGTITNVNQAINTIAGITSDPNYAAFVAAINNTHAAYQSVLGSSGVTPTAADEDALSALNPNSSAATIVASLNQLSKDAHALIVDPTYTKLNSYETTLGIPRT